MLDSGGSVGLGELAVRLVGSLALVVGLLLLIARFANRRFKAPSGAAIQVVQRQALGRGQGVAVISVGTRVLVLGTTEQQITLLAEVEPDEIGLDLTPVELIDDAAGGGTDTGTDTGAGEGAEGAPRPNRKSTRLNSSHVSESRMPSSA
mgnify:CR=1 FL=1